MFSSPTTTLKYNTNYTKNKYLIILTNIFIMKKYKVTPDEKYYAVIVFGRRCATLEEGLEYAKLMEKHLKEIEEFNERINNKTLL